MVIKTFLSTIAIAATLLTAAPVFAAQGNHLIVSNLKVPNRSQLQAGVPYEASIDIRTPGVSVELLQLCFVWGKDGPYCFKNYKMKKGSDGGVHPTIGLKTGNPGKYKLSAYMTYRAGGKKYESNATSLTITVR